MNRRFEVEGHMNLQFGPKWFVRSGEFTPTELKLLQTLRYITREVFPQDKLVLRPVVYTLHVEETGIGFFQCRVETENRTYLFSQVTLAELAADVENHLTAVP